MKRSLLCLASIVGGAAGPSCWRWLYRRFDAIVVSCVVSGCPAAGQVDDVISQRV